MPPSNVSIPEQEVTHPFNLQHTWLLDTVVSAVDPDAIYTCAIVKRRIISQAPRVSPLVTIFKRMKILITKSVTVVLSDASHRMFAVFPFEPTIVNFENKYCQPFTYHTKECLIRIVQADLIFTSPKRVYEMFGVLAKIPLVIMKVLDFELFQRDQVSFSVPVQRSLQELYKDPQYIKLCQHQSRDTQRNDDDDDDVSDNYDVVSI